MAWLRVMNSYVNLDAVAWIEFNNEAGRIRIDFYGQDNRVIGSYWVDYETAEKFKKGLDYLTQAMPIFVAAEKTEEAEAEPPTEG